MRTAFTDRLAEQKKRESLQGGGGSNNDPEVIFIADSREEDNIRGQNGAECLRREELTNAPRVQENPEVEAAIPEEPVPKEDVNPEGEAEILEEPAPREEENPEFKVEFSEEPDLPSILEEPADVQDTLPAINVEDEGDEDEENGDEAPPTSAQNLVHGAFRVMRYNGPPATKRPLQVFNDIEEDTLEEDFSTTAHLFVHARGQSRIGSNQDELHRLQEDDSDKDEEESDEEEEDSDEEDSEDEEDSDEEKMSQSTSPSPAQVQIKEDNPACIAEMKTGIMALRSPVSGGCLSPPSAAHPSPQSPSPRLPGRVQVFSAGRQPTGPF